MPYIKETNRGTLRRGSPPHSAGEFAFVISQLIVQYIQRKGLSFETLHSIDGILDTSLDEFRRRILYPYEDLKIEENGDVYHAILALLDRS